jgi:hypothetical protein
MKTSEINKTQNLPIFPSLNQLSYAKLQLQFYRMTLEFLSPILFGTWFEILFFDTPWNFGGVGKEIRKISQQRGNGPGARNC